MLDMFFCKAVGMLSVFW